MSLEKSFKYTFVSMGNWLILVSLGLLWLVGHPVSPTKVTFNNHVPSKRYQKGQMIWHDTILGSKLV